MLVSNLDLKIDERAYSYVQQVLNSLDLSSDNVSISKDDLEKELFNAYKKGFQTGIDVITEAVQSTNPNFHFIKKD